MGHLIGLINHTLAIRQIGISDGYFDNGGVIRDVLYRQKMRDKRRERDNCKRYELVYRLFSTTVAEDGCRVREMRWKLCQVW